MSNDQVREQFEAAMRGRGFQDFLFEKYDTGAYTKREAQVMWTAWETCMRTLSRSPAEPQQAPDSVREALHRLIENGGSMGPASAEDARLVAKWQDSLLTPSKAVEQQAPELRQVLEAVQREFRKITRSGNNMPDSFDSRVYRWVDDALATPPQPHQEPPSLQSIIADLKVEELAGTHEFVSINGHICKVEPRTVPHQEPAREVELLGIVRTAKAQAKRLIERSETRPVREQTECDLIDTLDVIYRALTDRAARPGAQGEAE